MFLKLFLTFLEIGAVSFGGGYGMISLIREKVLLNGWLSEAESKPPVRLNLWKFRFIVIFNQDNVIFHPVISAPFVGFCNEKHLLHVLKPCKIRAETVHLLPDK